MYKNVIIKILLCSHSQWFTQYPNKSKVCTFGGTHGTQYATVKLNINLHSYDLDQLISKLSKTI